MDYGFKISEAGYSVLTATDKQLALSTEFNHFKISEQGSGTKTVASSGKETVSISTTDNYVGFLVFYKDENGYWHLATTMGNQPVGNVWTNSHIDNGSLKIIITNNTGSSEDVDYKYYIFIEQG